jgi:SWI/SNF-related matrix-associated actin-dependent regulator 1 of chromatin subfamily A
MSSEESSGQSGQTLGDSSKSRLTKTGSSPSLASRSLSESPGDRDFISFRMTNPTESPARIQAAWNQAAGDVKRASGYLADSMWSPTPPPSAIVEKEGMGRVKEIEEASKAQRAAVKEKGKKSLIYANRPILEINSPTTPPPTKPVIDLTTPLSAAPASPLTPAIKGPQRRRAKKLVIHSDDESDFTDSAADDRDVERERSEEVTYEMRALEYLNCSSPEALQELTGECLCIYLEHQIC